MNFNCFIRLNLFLINVYSISEQKLMAASRLENVTQTIARILEGYDIRLRPNFGGNMSVKVEVSIFYDCSLINN